MTACAKCGATKFYQERDQWGSRVVCRGCSFAVEVTEWSMPAVGSQMGVWKL